MIRRIFLFCVPLIIISNTSASVSSIFELPEVTSYAKVSRNVPEVPTILTKKNNTNFSTNEGRSFQDLLISRSPIYVPPKISKLRNGEAVDHSSTRKYSTIDEEAVAKLDSDFDKKNRAQDRFHPPASFEHALAQANSVRQQSSSQQSSGSQNSGSSNAVKVGFPVPSYATLPKNIYSSSYDYQTNSKPGNENSQGTQADDYSADSGDSFSKVMIKKIIYN